MRHRLTFAILLSLMLLTACSPADPNQGSLKVVATTTIVGDVVARVGGEHIQLSVLLEPGTDPHSFQPTPKDLVLVEQADLVFANGFGLESFLGNMLQQASASAQVVEVSEGIPPLLLAEEDENEHTADEDEHGSGYDPHVWLDPHNIQVWVDNIAAALAAADPANAESYQSNAAAYQQELSDLDSWIIEQLASLPQERRLLVSDHYVFGYFARAYGFEVRGTLTGFSSLSEPSAQELAALEDTILASGVRAIFVSTTVPTILAERVAADTGVVMVPVYTGALSSAGGPAATYLDLMRYLVKAMVENL